MHHTVLQEMVNGTRPRSDMEFLSYLGQQLEQEKRLALLAVIENIRREIDHVSVQMRTATGEEWHVLSIQLESLQKSEATAVQNHAAIVSQRQERERERERQERERERERQERERERQERERERQQQELDKRLALLAVIENIRREIDNVSVQMRTATGEERHDLSIQLERLKKSEARAIQNHAAFLSAGEKQI
jgi:hypothetical protein